MADEYAIHVGESADLGEKDMVSTQRGRVYVMKGEAGRTYFWRVDSINRAGVTEGPVWRYTTAAEDGIGCVIYPTRAAIRRGQSTTLVWNIYNYAGNAPTLTIDNDLGAQTTQSTGSTAVTPAATTTYTASARTRSSEATCAATVFVTPSETSNIPPIGELERVAEDGISVEGWTYDPNDSESPIRVLFYSDGPLGNGRYLGETRTSVYRQDVNTTYGIEGDHGFSFPIPPGFRNGQPHRIYAYAIDSMSELPEPLGAGLSSFSISTEPSVDCSPLVDSSARWVNLDFEGGSLIHHLAPKPYFHLDDYVVRKRKYQYTVVLGSRYSTWLARGSAATGCRSLAIGLSSESDVNVQDKVMLGIVNPKSPHALSVASNTPKFLAFDLKFDETYELPKRRFLLHMQALQCCSGSPPMSIQVLPNTDPKGPIRMSFEVRDDINPRGKEVYRKVVKRGVWYNLIIELVPSHNADNDTGRLKLWLNGNLEFSYAGDWGYVPTSLGGEFARKEFMSIGLGIYRRRQPTAELIYLDNIKYGPTYDSVH